MPRGRRKFVRARRAFGSEPSRSVEVETAAPLASLAWPGTNVVISITKDGTSKSVDAGEVVGTLNATSAGGTPVSVPLVAVASLHQ